MTVAARHSLRAVARRSSSREIFKFAHQYGRLVSALVRPVLWLVVFAAGFQQRLRRLDHPALRHLHHLPRLHRARA